MATGPSPSPVGPPRRGRLAELAWLFGRLGVVGFGGPAAHLAMVRDEVVRRRGWLTDAELADLIGAASLIPGPTSTEVALHVGHRRAGWPGFAVAGLAFILPAVAIVAVLAWAYVEYGSTPAVGALLVGIAPVVVAIVVHAAAGLARSVLRTRLSAGIAIAAAIGALAGLPEPVVLVAGGIGAIAVRVPVGWRSAAAGTIGLPGLHGGAGLPGIVGGLVGSAGPIAAVAAGPIAATTPAIFETFLRIGAVLFGSGYVLIAFLRAELVVRLGWLTDAQLLDAVAVGQVTPGPLFSTATFAGWLVGGPAGAAAATAGIFLPAFVFVALSVPLLPRIRRSTFASALLDGVTAASLGLIAVVGVQLARAAIQAPLDLAVALAALGLMAGGRLGPARLVGLGAVVGLARGAIGV